MGTGQFEVETLRTPDNAEGNTAIMVAELREMAKQMAAQSAARAEIEAQFEAYRARPWWKRVAG